MIGKRVNELMPERKRVLAELRGAVTAASQIRPPHG